MEKIIEYHYSFDTSDESRLIELLSNELKNFGVELIHINKDDDGYFNGQKEVMLIKSIE